MILNFLHILSRSPSLREAQRRSNPETEPRVLPLRFALGRNDGLPVFCSKPHVKWLFYLVFVGMIYANVGYADPTPEQEQASVEATRVCVPPANAPLTPVLRAHIAQWLDWQDFSPKEKNVKGCQYNLCGGTYHEPALEGFSSELPQQDDARIFANAVSLRPEGQSELEGSVLIIQPNRQLTADTAYIYRDPNTKKITQINLFGHVSYREPGGVVYGREGHYLLGTNQGYLDDAMYRFSLGKPRQLETPDLLQAWGRAASVERDNQRYYLTDATYTTCPPKDSSWQIKAKKLTLDHETGRGEAVHAFLDVGNWPVVYFPYYNFPIDNRRQSGFLAPIVGYSNNLGFNFGAPYYWNIAPNYDLLLTPNYYSERGLGLDTNFRYLTEKSRGEFTLNGIYHDQAFEQFVQENQDQIGDLSDNRYEMFFKNHTAFTENWSLNAQYHKVSDDYYLQNFGTSISETTANQLLQQVDLDYLSEHWTSTLMMQHYQTLDPINEGISTSDVYSRYPSWVLNGNYANLPGQLNFLISNQYDDFVWTGSNESSQAIGGRYHVNPVLTRPILDPGWYIKPMLQLQETYYGLSQNPTDQGTSFDTSMNIFVPQTSVDSGLYFDRSANFWGKDWNQTLEPRLYYLYTPEVNQTQVPNFDSAYYIFTYDQLFRSNRFSGLDRVGDANQVALAVMSRFLDADSGTEVFHWGIGEVYYFEDRQVQLMQEEPGQPYADSSTTTVGYTSSTDSYSPIASQISYRFHPSWSLVGDGAWDPNTSDLNNATVNLHYQPGINQVINVGYSFLVNGDQTGTTGTGTSDGNLNQTLFSYAWPITPNHQWSSVGSWTQNISHNYPMSYSLGIQYEDCCWAVRLLGGKLYNYLDENNNPVYNNSVYLQILLKGLGNVASSSPALVTGIPGYQDIFK